VKDTNETTNGGNRLSTRQLLVKIPNYPGLYRHTVNQKYYGIVKRSGKRKEHSLDTADRKIAERRLREWIETLDTIDTEAEKTTLIQLIEKFSKARQGKSESTRDTEASIIKIFKADWEYGLDIRISKVKPSMLDEWLAKQEPRLKHSSYNRYAQFLKHLFSIATADRMIHVSPFDGIKKKWKRPEKPVRRVPTDEQFAAIVKDIRAQRFNAEHDDSADFVEFLGLAGLGQAEASALRVEDIDWQQNRFAIRRRKTKALFYVPVYPDLKPFLKRVIDKLGPDAPREAKVFKIQDAKKALAAACKRLKFPNFSQRSIRAYLIGRLWKASVDIKLIAQWQGHTDGGKLILNTYTEVFGANDNSYVESQLAKLTQSKARRETNITVAGPYSTKSGGEVIRPAPEDKK